MKTIDQSVLQAMTDRLVAEFDPDKVILFGSYAWGEPTEDSDVDLFVVVSESEERPLQRARRARSCLKDVRVAKDVLVRTHVEMEKYRQVHASLESLMSEQGKVLYERQ